MFSYQNLEVYKKAFAQNRQVYSFLKTNKSVARYLKDQLGRSSLSIMLNIAEGSGKFSKKDRKKFFIIARGSTFESAAIVEFLYAEGEIPEELKNQLSFGLEEISKILFVMIRNLEAKK